MKHDKKLSALNMAVQNLKAKKSRTLFMMFFVVLMAATVFFSTILMENMRQGIKSTTERAGADIIVVPDEGTEISEILCLPENHAPYFSTAP
mgnify:FL=1